MHRIIQTDCRLLTNTHNIISAATHSSCTNICTSIFDLSPRNSTIFKTTAHLSLVLVFAISALREETEAVKPSRHNQLRLIDSIQCPIRRYKTAACPMEVALCVWGEGPIGIQQDLSFWLTANKLLLARVSLMLLFVFYHLSAAVMLLLLLKITLTGSFQGLSNGEGAVVPNGC